MSNYPRNALVATVSAAAMGVAFGTAFAKSHVFEPSIIRDQFLFRRFVMLKMFLGAMGTGALMLCFCSVALPSRFQAARALWEGGPKSRGWLTGPTFGCTLLGAGMAIAGACPGMVLSQLGAGVPNSGYTFLGGLAGALAFGLVHQSVAAFFYPQGPQGPARVYADRYSKHSYTKLSLALGLACVVFAGILEALCPWKDELPTRLQEAVNNCSGPYDCPAWPPSIGGALLGAMQLPAVALIQTFLGSATSYQVTVSAWMMFASKRLQRSLPYMTMFSKPQVITWWQLPYVSMAVVASGLWASYSHDFGTSVGVPASNAFVGGFLMLFGSRWAGGCTTGHGISGCAILTVQSFAAVPAMFAAGILVSFLLESTSGGAFAISD